MTLEPGGKWYERKMEEEMSVRTTIPEMGGLQDMVAPPLEQLIPKSCRFSTVMPENTVEKRLTLSYVC